MTKLSATTLGFRRFSTRPSAPGSFRPGPEFRLSPKTFQFPKLRSFGGKFLFRQRRPVNSPWWRDSIRCGASHPCLPGRGFSRLRIERCVLLMRLSACGASFPHVSETRPAAIPRTAAAAGTWTVRSVSFLRAEGPVFFAARQSSGGEGFLWKRSLSTTQHLVRVVVRSSTRMAAEAASM